MGAYIGSARRFRAASSDGPAVDRGGASVARGTQRRTRLPEGAAYSVQEGAMIAATPSHRRARKKSHDRALNRKQARLEQRCCSRQRPSRSQGHPGPRRTCSQLAES